jgi:hypothetical protein
LLDNHKIFVISKELKDVQENIKRLSGDRDCNDVSDDESSDDSDNSSSSDALDKYIISRMKETHRRQEVLHSHDESAVDLLKQ